MVDKPPTEDALLRAGQRAWELPEHRPNLTATRAAYRPYSTYVSPKVYVLKNGHWISTLSPSRGMIIIPTKKKRLS